MGSFKRYVAAPRGVSKVLQPYPFCITKWSKSVTQGGVTLFENFVIFENFAIRNRAGGTRFGVVPLNSNTNGIGQDKKWTTIPNSRFNPGDKKAKSGAIPGPVSEKRDRGSPSGPNAPHG